MKQAVKGMEYECGISWSIDWSCGGLWRTGSGRMVVNEVYRDKPGWSEGSQCHAKENQ